MKRFALVFTALFLVVFVNFLYEKLSSPTHFTVTPDTKIDPNSELAKYVTQEEIDDFGFRYWDIDEYEERNATLSALRNLLRLKDTDKILNFMKRNELGADVKMKADTTPLMYSSFYDDEATAKRLIDMGANAHAQDNYKLSPLAYAIENNSTKTAKLLLDSEVKFSNKEKIQRYLKAPQNDRIKSLTIDGDNIFVEYEVKYGQKNEGSKGWILPFDYITFGNFTEMLQILFNMGYFDENGNYFKDMEYMPNYEPMLNLLLDNNVSGQPTSEELKEAYKKCHDKVGVFTAAREGYIYKMNKGRVQDLEQPCNTISSHLAKVSLNGTDPVLMINQRYRRFSPREAANIQSFPNVFKFEKVSDNRKYRAIGNAVPPVLMWHIAQALAKLIL